MSTTGNSPLFRAAKGLTSPDPTPLAPEPLTWAAIVELARTYRPEGRPDGEERVRLGMLCKRIIDAAAARSPADPSPEPLREALREVAENNHREGFHDEDGGPASFQECADPYCQKAASALVAPTAGAGGLAAQMLRWIVEHPDRLGDWACVECHPESGILVAGFRCVVHEAAALLAAEYAALAPVAHRPTTAEPRTVTNTPDEWTTHRRVRPIEATLAEMRHPAYGDAQSVGPAEENLVLTRLVKRLAARPTPAEPTHPYTVNPDTRRSKIGCDFKLPDGRLCNQAEASPVHGEPGEAT